MDIHSYTWQKANPARWFSYTECTLWLPHYCIQWRPRERTTLAWCCCLYKLWKPYQESAPDFYRRLFLVIYTGFSKLHMIQFQKHPIILPWITTQRLGLGFSTYFLIFFLTFSPVHPSIHVSMVLLPFLYGPAVDTPPVKPAALGSLNQCIRQLWRPLQSTALKKPLLGTGEQLHFFYRYVAALGSSAL